MIIVRAVASTITSIQIVQFMMISTLQYSLLITPSVLGVGFSFEDKK